MIELRGYSVADPLRDSVRAIATSWQASYLLHGDTSWWFFDPTADRPLRRQGWKVHVSTVPVVALDTVRRVADVVMRRGLRWKVARSIGQLTRMCAPPAPVPQVGKFITVYIDDGDPGEVAAELHEATRLFDGPVIPSDQRYHRGSNVYLRYGSFSPARAYLGPDQVSKGFVVDPNGHRVEDSRAPGQHTPSWVAAGPAASATRPPARGTGLFGRGIAVREVLAQSAKGGVYRCDWRGGPVVLKEARIGTCPDLLGRDARTRLLNEWRILRELKGTGLAPEPLDCFFEEDNAYLVEEFLPGATLRDVVERMNYIGPLRPAALLAMWRAVCDAVTRVQAHHILLRDLTPNNIMVVGDRYALIDLELSVRTCSPEPRYIGWTPGYARVADDTGAADAGDAAYALAAIGQYIFTGVDPYLGRTVPFSSHVDAVLREFWPGDAATAELAQVRARLVPTAAAAPPVRRRPAPGTAVTPPEQIVAEAAAAGRELVAHVEWERRPWPWPDRWSPGSAHPASFMAGTTGIVQYYLDLWHATQDRDWLRHADDLLDWTFDTFPYVPGQTPSGLYFGLAAMPWLMAELAAVCDASRARQLQYRATELAASLAAWGADTWDVTHGCAGIGLAATAVLCRTGDTGCRDAAGALVDRLIAGKTEVAGVPVWPRADRSHFGFAHGSAGIGYFMLHSGPLVKRPMAVQLAVDIGRALLSRGVPVAGGRGVTWPHGPDSAQTPWTHWCNGAAGVGQFLLSLWSATADADFLDAALHAGRAITLGRPFGSCCRCHGLAGDGDFLLELAQHRDHREEFHAGAEHIGRKLGALMITDDFAPKWPSEGDGEPRPGFMRGYTGIHSFRLRLAGLLRRGPLLLPTPEMRHQRDDDATRT